MTRDGFSGFLGIQKFPGEDPRTPLPDKKIMWFIFLFNTAQPKPWVKNKVFN